MPFRKIDAEAEIQTRCESDPEFRRVYDIVDKEYALIEEAIVMRRRQGYTQEEIAKNAGLTQQAISRMEKLSNRPTLRNFIRYLDAAGLELIIQEKEEKDRVENPKILS